MSRIGREPIAVPAGVTITVADGNKFYCIIEKIPHNFMPLRRKKTTR